MGTPQGLVALFMRYARHGNRDTTARIPSRDITEVWVAYRGLYAREATLVILRKRTGAILKNLRIEDVVSEVARLGNYKGRFWSG